MSYNFNWSVLWTGQSGSWLIQGVLTTLHIFALGLLIALALGIVAGALRTMPFAPLRWLASGYVEFFRNVPLLVWMFFWYFGVPPVLPQAIQDWLFDHGVEFWAGVFAIGVYHGARFSEVIRAGIQSIPKTQLEAALSTGLTIAQAYRLIIVPIALRLIVPPATNEIVNLLKNSSVALTIGVAELTFQTRQIETYTAKAFEALAAGTIIYLILCLAIASIMAGVERRVAIPGMIAQDRPERPKMDFSVVTNNFVFLIVQGFLGIGAFTGGTLRLAVPAIVLGFILGTLIGLARLSQSRWLYWPAKIYIEFFRGVPLVMVIFWFWFIVPTLAGKSLPEYAVALTAFVIFEAAYLAEIVRAGIQSVPRGQVEAATATGLSKHQLMRHVILPQALRNMIPALVTQFIVLLKDTSLASIIGYVDLTKAAQIVNNREIRPFELYLFIAVVYWLCSYAMSLYAQRLELRLASR